MNSANNMRRFFLLIGLLLIPTAASASALSPWVDHVISRADNAMGFALGLPVGSCGDPEVMQEIENNLSLVRSSVNASVDLAQEAQFTKERTVCFQSDRRLLEDELKHNRQRIDFHGK